MEEKKTFIMFRSYYEAAKQIPDKEGQADFLLAVLSYGFDNVEPEHLTGWAKAMFEVARPHLEASRKKAEAGSLGGSTRKQTESNIEANGKQTVSKHEAIKNKELRIKNEELRMKNEETPQKPPKGAKTGQPKVQWAEFVTMTNAEHDKLLAAYGPADTQRLIEILDNYKGSSGKKYNSDYRAILNWVVGRLQEEKAKNRPKDGGTDNIFLTMLAKEREKAEPPDNDWGDLP